ncbi:unnamed protein product [Strongylus vulgaris]|uniref:Uncharacterized protein n=1 Tax=Strongylus vulgaris TaxID=40348 RepID=A0A3P7JFZ6_STRVU|nr:unnamed protein product [Strongylus vulgaris]
MERLGRVWTRLSVRRPTLPTVEPPEEDDDDELPHTKNAVFEMFSHSTASKHRQSELSSSPRERGQSECGGQSSIPQRKLRSPLPTRSGNMPISGSKSTSDAGESPSGSKGLAIPKHGAPLGRSASFTEESTSVMHNPASVQSVVRDVSQGRITI